jgi:hypothetical protein
MPWVQKTTHAGKCIYIQRHYSSRYGSKHKCTRGSNYGKTSEAQAAVNNRQGAVLVDGYFHCYSPFLIRPALWASGRAASCPLHGKSAVCDKCDVGWGGHRKQEHKGQI